MDNQNPISGVSIETPKSYNHNEIILYNPNDSIRLEVMLNEETVWLTQAQIAMLFGTKRPAITKHLNNIYQSGELNENSTCSILERMGNDGKQQYPTKYYNLDAILSVGYRVNSFNATMFRRWANSVLKDYLLKGYAINQRFEQVDSKLLQHEQRLLNTEKQIAFFIQTALPPLQGIFFNGQIFEAYAFVAQLVKAAKQSIILIDNYVDESVLLLLSKRAQKVSAEIFTANLSAQLQLDIERHNAQFPPIELHINRRFHDRFLLIDNEVYHIGASLKDLGKKLFAFSKMACPKEYLFSNPINQ